MADDYLVPGYKVTKELVLAALEKSTGLRPEIAEIKPLGDVLGYMSAIVRVELKWQESKESLPDSVIVKIPLSKKLEELEHEHIGDVPLELVMHDAEVSAYSALASKPSPMLRLPKLYEATTVLSGQPAIIMEDFKNTTVTDLIEGFNKEQLLEIIDALVGIHKWSDENKGIWDNKIFFNYDDEQMMDGWQGACFTAGQALAAKNDKLNEPIQILFDHLKSNGLFKLFAKKLRTDPNAVVAHCDLWTPNVLWNGSTLASIVDWALCRKGSRMEDLQRALATSTSVKTRRAMTSELLQRYAAAVAKPLKEIEDEYNRCMPYTAAVTIFAVDMWSKSPVLKRGEEDDSERIGIMEDRLLAFLEDMMAVYKWK